MPNFEEGINEEDEGVVKSKIEEENKDETSPADEIINEFEYDGSDLMNEVVNMPSWDVDEKEDR